MVLIRINENGEKINSWNSFAILSSSLCLKSVKRWGLREFWWESFTSPSVKCWPGLSAELHVTVLCTGFRVYRSCLCEEQGFIPVTILVNICYPWLSHACWELCFIAVGSANSQVESLQCKHWQSSRMLCRCSFWSPAVCKGQFGCSPLFDSTEKQELGNKWDYSELSPWKMLLFPECVHLGNDYCWFSCCLLVNYPSLRCSWNKWEEK